MRIHGVLQGSQSCLISLVVHLVMLVGLGLFGFSDDVLGDQMALTVAAPVEELAVDEFAIETDQVVLQSPESSAEIEEIADLTDSPKYLSDAAANIDVDAVATASGQVGFESLDRIPLDNVVAVNAAEDASAASSVSALAAAMAVGFNNEAHAAASKRVGKGYGDSLQTLRDLPKDYVVVVRGAHDQMEAVLSHYKIPHVLVNELELEHLRHAKIVCLNCGCPVIDRGMLRKFVEVGGVLVSSDYALINTAMAFPEYIQQGPGVSGDDVFPISRRGKDAGLLKGVFAEVDAPQWWLETASYFVKVDSYKVEVLATSDAMAKQYNTTNIVACHFQHGKGNVLHLVGHFHQRRGNIDGLVAMHRMVFNLFLAAAPQK